MAAKERPSTRTASHSGGRWSFYVLGLFCCIAVAVAKQNNTEWTAQYSDDAAWEGKEGQTDEVVLGSVDEAAMLHWAVEHADPRKMQEMAAEARRWTQEDLEAKHAELQQLLERVRPPSDFEVMEELLGIASNTSEPSDRRAGALEALQEVVEAIDNAHDLDKLGGIRTIVELLVDKDPGVRTSAAWVVGAAAQNNAEVQDKFLNTTCLPTLLELVRTGGSEEASKALYAISALVRDNTLGLREFYQNGGPALLRHILSCESGDSRLQKKAVVLLGDLASFQGGRNAPGYDPLETPQVMSALLHLMSSSDKDLREKVVRSTHALLAPSQRALKLFQEKASQVEKLQTLQHRVEEMGEEGRSDEESSEWEEVVASMAEVVKPAERVKERQMPMLGGPGLRRSELSRNEL